MCGLLYRWLPVGMMLLLAGGPVWFQPSCRAAETDPKMDAWVFQLSAEDGEARRDASRRLLEAGNGAVAALRRANPGQPQIVHPNRAAILLALIEDKKPEGASESGFGLSVEPGTRRREVEAAGRKFGFVLKPDARFNSAARPACYVELATGQHLMGVLKKVMTDIPWVTTVNFRMMER